MSALASATDAACAIRMLWKKSAGGRLYALRTVKLGNFILNREKSLQLKVDNIAKEFVEQHDNRTKGKQIAVEATKP